MTLKDASGTTVAGSAAFDASSRTVKFTPAAPLSYSATYTASVSASSATGVPMAAPETWTFTVAATDPLPGICPCSIWTDSATPATASVTDNGNVEVGVKFTADVDGSVNGVRFYKGATNVGTHTGSLWTLAGARLATLTFTGESSSGWQTGYFTSPVDITAGTTYIVSYRAPTGGYAVTPNGLSVGVDNSPLHALANGAVYTYGSGAPLSASDANYWVDVVYTANDVAPTVSSVSPAPSSSNVPRSSTFTTSFAGLLQAGTAQLAVADASGTPVAGTSAYSAATRTITFTPSSPLAEGTTYTATASGATALSGYVMSPYSWTVTTAGVAVCPCTLFSSSAVPTTIDGNDGSGIEVGTSFSPSTSGKITGLRFYKSALNTGTHTGTLWSSAGAVLATGTFTGESASGWQSLTFARPVAVTAGTTYVVSYYAPNGHYSASSHFFDSAWTNGPLTVAAGNGLYRYGSASAFPLDAYGATNYWVDPFFEKGAVADTTAPQVVATDPYAGSTSQSVTATPSAVFDEDVTPSSITVDLRGPSGAVVPGAVGYDAAGRRATFTPTSDLARGATYTASVSASDVAGNALAAPVTWTFTTALPDPAAGVCPCSLWTDASTPANVSQNDPKTIEVGTAFTADTTGSVTGVRFYKGPLNPGSHTVSLWTTAGDRLATATSTTESSAGWQTVGFGSPVAITAGTTYVVSYLAPSGYYSATPELLSSTVDSPPLHTVATGGRYVYGGGYPASASSASYWVDPVFVTGVVADTTAPVITAVGSAPSGGTATVTWTTDESSTSVVSYGTTPALGLTATGTSGSTHAVTLGGLGEDTVYYYRVTSVDPAGNSSTSPAAAAAPATFRTPDLTAPVVTGVVGTVAANGTGATVTWTTDESATSVLSWGTTTALGSTATGASGTSHTVTLSGLPDGATYYYRVTSVDAAGNSTTSPATSAAAATFVLPDRTAPVVTAVAATGTGTTATVTWTTNESSTSVVRYGTTATSLTGTATGTTGTAHSVTLTGLTTNTRYYYRVTSADAAVNTTTVPVATATAASYVPTVAPISQTSAADFTTGTLTGAYVSQTGDGEVMQAPSTGVEFVGTALPSGWTSASLASGSSTTVGNGTATLSGTRLSSTATTTSVKSIEIAAASLTRTMRLGFGNTGGTVYAGFGVDTSGRLVALANDGRFFNTTTVVTGVNPLLPHRYRVDWISATQVRFSVDGVATAGLATNFWPSGSLNAVLQDTAVDTTPLVVDWLRVSPFDASDSYVSRVFDAGATVGWDTLSFTGSVPTGTTRTIQVRSGPTATPGTGWTGWTTVSTSGGSITRSARYLQYQVLMTSTGTRFVSSSTDSVQMGFHVL